MLSDVLGKKVKLDEISINQSLVYAIKTLSGDSENEIIEFYYNLGVKLFIDCVSRKTIPQKCNRVVKLFYKNTSLNTRFEVRSTFFRSMYTGHDPKEVKVYMDITFPNDKLILDGQKIIDSINDNTMGFTEDQCVNLEKPREKVYKCLTKKT